MKKTETHILAHTVECWHAARPNSLYESELVCPRSSVLNGAVRECMLNVVGRLCRGRLLYLHVLLTFINYFRSLINRKIAFVGKMNILSSF